MDSTATESQRTNVKQNRCASGQGVTQPLDEVTEVLAFRQLPRKKSLPGEPIHMDPRVELQLRELILSIAKMYRNNPFHNFDHVSHVAMSTKKLLDRISERERESELEDDTCTLRFTNPITSDPITRDHPGVSNAQLVQEGSALAIQYDGKSVAEQNSVDLLWSLLMETRFVDLHRALFPTDTDCQQFRRIVVNLVMATDLFDKDLKSLRDSRWEKSFGLDKQLDANNTTEDESNRCTTITIELLLQASDVSHTMQPFTVYKKWNRNLLTDMYDAYKCGRTSKNPLDDWYEGELWFLDNYIIPLAQKLRECGVFGVSCDEFLDYAKDNRAEWEMKGREIVVEFAADLKFRRARHVSEGQSVGGVFEI